MALAKAAEQTPRRPVWGDVSDLIALLDVRSRSEGRFISTPRDADSDHRGVVEGSQMLAQSIVAASRHTQGRRVVHASMVFMRAAGTGEPLELELEELSGGRSFTTLAPRVRQGDRTCASGIMLLDATAPDVMRHAVPKPVTASVDASPPFDMGVTGREIRFVDGAYTGDPEAPAGPPVIEAWVRYRDVPEDPAIHAALLAHFTGHVSIAAAMRPHAGIGQAQAHRTLSTAINAIHLAFHADVRADRWTLYRHHSTFAGDGMTHSECRVHAEGGELLASFSVDAMVRGFPKKQTPGGRGAL
ncbi:MAG: thioesterase family protein [Myxococcales bacterium]|nr:thioesterase family protein [Myxococcales bacterium]